MIPPQTSQAPVSPVTPEPVRPDAESRYFNRELSWLAFNRRVIEEACNTAHPLLERLRFLSISGSNLDEFFMTRVAGLIGQQIRGVEQRSADGRTPKQQLAAIVEVGDALVDSQQGVWRDLLVALAEQGIRIVDGEALDADGAAWLATHFREQLFPILTPQALDPAHPFPFIPNGGLSVIFDLVRLSDQEPIRELVLLPAGVSRFVRLPGEDFRFLTIEDVIKRFSGTLFPGYEVKASAAFRILRDSDIELEEEAEDLVLYFRSAIKRRRRGRVIRLEMESGIDPELEQVLKEELGGARALLTEIGGFLGIGDLSRLVEIERPDLRFAPFVARFPERIREFGGDCFAAIKAKDIIVHHPYESFDVVLEFLKQAAADPDVVAIKQTLYRAGKQSAVVNALIAAAEAGKSVTAVIELKARFDEEQNLLWASALERAGVQVVYGFIDWKTHAKISMVVRREGGGFKTYCHFGTGNYHPVTARIYTDLSFFTADPRLGRDAAAVFNYITGYVEPDSLELLHISPRDLRRELSKLIDAEIGHALAGRPAAIWAKMNSLVDPAIIEKLYEASNAGVEIDLIVRGICCLRPGVPEMSARIRVRSIVGRFLEHSRIWTFANGKDLPNDGAKVFLSSADWMPRNFDRRVEFMLPVLNETVHDQVLDQVMVANLLDSEQSWELQSDGRYARVAPGAKPFNLHRYFMTNPSLSGRGEGKGRRGKVPTLSLARRGRVTG
ncbi:RNA degradosome polyphosphate kinase [uncultured Sphingomonas sp.]|uniref:RNA degradosome polyphosphate kinase n=1 Tax=uncultured Sphingomonas sp. TaxID=158754 RepID=UPI0037489BB0